jgi:hypothetical protein
MYKEFKMEAYFMIKVSSKGLPVLPMRISSIFGRKQEFSSSTKFSSLCIEDQLITPFAAGLHLIERP